MVDSHVRGLVVDGWAAEGSLLGGGDASIAVEDKRRLMSFGLMRLHIESRPPFAEMSVCVRVRVHAFVCV